jgi:hypothetical protein
VWSLGSTLSKGLTVLGSRGAVGQSDPRFLKVNASGSYDRALQACGAAAEGAGPV